MYNGTRIDPEEHEPHAIKIGGRKQKRSGKAVAFFAAFVVFAAFIGVFVFMFLNPDLELPKIFGDNEIVESSSEESSESSSEVEEPVSSQSSSSLPESSSEPEPEPEVPAIPKDEWYMILVNEKNPLPEDFTVEAAAIDSEGHTIDTRAYADLTAMIEAGEAEGLKFIFYTAYRSVAKQKELYEAGKTTAAPGTSEHNSGLAIDIGSAVSEDFEGSKEEAWLLEHAHEYGFILRYPKGKEDITGFDYEPWHFRYVGKEQAKLIYESGLCLEEYLEQ